MHVVIDEQLFAEVLGSVPAAVGRRLSREAARVPDSLVCSEQDVSRALEEVLRADYGCVQLSDGGRDALLKDIMEDLAEDEALAVSVGTFSRGRVREGVREFLAERLGVDEPSPGAVSAAA